MHRRISALLAVLALSLTGALLVGAGPASAVETVVVDGHQAARQQSGTEPGV